MHGHETPLDPFDNQQSRIIGNSLTVCVLTVIVVILRLITRIRVVHSVGWDDYTIVAAALGQVVSTALAFVEVHYGFGRHEEFLSGWTFHEFEKYAFGAWILFFQTLMFNKLSICFFILRIPAGYKYIRPIHGAIVVLIVSNVILTCLYIFQCRPISDFWNEHKSSHCMTGGQNQRIIMSQALISIIFDVLLALFPIVLLWNVNISARVKAGLCSLMALGLL